MVELNRSMSNGIYLRARARVYLHVDACGERGNVVTRTHRQTHRFIISRWVQSWRCNLKPAAILRILVIVSCKFIKTPKLCLVPLILIKLEKKK